MALILSALMPMCIYLAYSPRQGHRDRLRRCDGNAAIAVKRVLDKNVLPLSRYLFRIKASGNNWDRKTVFVTVK